MRNTLRSRITGALKNSFSFDFLLDETHKYDHAQDTIYSAIGAFEPHFFEAARRGIHGESINGFVASLTSQWNFMELTAHQTDPRLRNTQRVFAHAEGLIVRLKKSKDIAFSVYTKEDTKNVQAFIKNPESTHALKGLRQTFNQKAKAESCKIFVGYGKDFSFPNDYNEERIIAEPVPNSPMNCISLRRFLGDAAYDQVPHEMKCSLQSLLDDLIMRLGHLKYKSGNLFPDDSMQEDRYTGIKRKRDDNGKGSPEAKRMKYS
ncbi:MAG: hypothetical protein F9K49_08705 [Caedimonadaceae bacterium]|nr:MAG: hypothetical protein F9K49_08705 [Caedimonadaceae bacterium]